MGNLITSHPVAAIAFCGIFVITILGFIYYKIVNRKKFDYDAFEDDNNTNEELSTRTNSYARIQNTI
jgi:hypothetical protein